MRGYVTIALLLIATGSFADQLNVVVTDTAYVAQPIRIDLSPSVTCYSRARFASCWADPGSGYVIGQQMYELLRIEVDGLPYIYASKKPLGKSGSVVPGKYSATKIYRKITGLKGARGIKPMETHLGFSDSNGKLIEFRMVGAPGPAAADEQ